MTATMRANLRTMRSVDEATTIGQTASHMLDIGRRIRWKAKASSSGKMERCTQDSSLMISERDRARSSGPTAASTSVSGRPASSMELEST